MKILIENAVPLNNGDAALIFSLGEKLTKKGYDVYYSTFNYKRVIEKYPEKNWVKSPLTRKRISKIPILRILYLSGYLCFKPLYRQFSAVISAPGGYINSFYGFEKKLLLLSLYRKIFKIPIFMYSQSIGELSVKDQKILARRIQEFKLFYVRDEVSFNRIMQIGTFSQVHKTKDAAFLFSPSLETSPLTKHICISVRRWTENKEDVNIYIKNMADILTYLISNKYKITFLSSCQGENGYPDDSKIAQEIVDLTSKSINTSKVVIDDKAYKLNELREKIATFDLVIGTRLHMCILSWISGIPAFNISYEEKGVECYEYLGIKHYSMPYGSKDEQDIEKIKKFLGNSNFDDVFLKINRIHNENIFYLEYMVKIIEEEFSK